MSDISLSIMPLQGHPRRRKRQGLLFTAKQCSMVRMYPIFSIHSSIHGHSGHPLTLAIVTNAVVNRGCTHLFEMLISFPLDVRPDVELLGHKAALFLIGLRNLLSVSHSSCSSLPPSRDGGGRQSWHLLPHKQRAPFVQTLLLLSSYN